MAFGKKKDSFQIKLSKNDDELLLHKGSLFWHSSTENSTFYTALSEDVETDICIVGGGMSGALIANQLLKEGFQVVVLDKMQPGHGSSNGNTGIIQYNSDRSLLDFIKIEGEEKAKDFYQLCHDSMKKLLDIARGLRQEVGYKKIESVYISAKESDEEMFLEETKALQSHGFPAQYVNREELFQTYDLIGKHGIVTQDDAMINPYKLIQALHKDNVNRAGKIYGNTFVSEVVKDKKSEKMEIKTEEGHVVTATHVIFCTGYMESYDSLKNRDVLHSTYSMVTKPIEGKLWAKNRMVWDAEDPYLYFRVTEDNRIIAGGLDEETKELSNLTTINRKGTEILEAIKKYYPQLEAEPHYVWQSVFGVSKDEIPFIGEDPKLKNIYYALGFGGNGTCYSVAAADILTSLIKGLSHPYAYVVDPARK